jgi:hypothetical protein
MGEPAEDLLPLDSVRWPRARCGQRPVQVMLVDDKQPVGECPAQVPMSPSQMAFAFGACGGLATILMPSAVNTASNELVNWPARSLIRNFTEAARWPQVHQEIAGYLRGPCAVGVRGDAGGVGTAGAVLEDDQRVDGPEQHGVYVDEIGGDDATGLGGQELLPR